MILTTNDMCLYISNLCKHFILIILICIKYSQQQQTKKQQNKKLKRKAI
jgi:hypothetical protein